MSGERIDAAADVNPHPVHHCGLIPGALRDRDHARHDAGRYPGGQHHAAAAVEDHHLFTILDAARLRVDRIHHHHIGVEVAEFREVMERGVNPAVPVEAEALQRESLSFGVTRHIPGPVEDRDRGNDIPFGDLPVRGFTRELFGIDLDLAARSLQRVLHRVLPERFKRDRVLAVAPDLRHTVLPEGREVRELRDLLPRFLVAPLHPAHLRAAFGEFLLEPELRGEKPADLKGRLLVIHRLHGFLDREHAGHVAVRAALARRVVRFGAERIGEQDIRVAGGRRHHVVADEDKFALRRVAEHLIRPVAVAVLIDHRVAARIHDHLDSGAEFLCAVKR